MRYPHNPYDTNAIAVLVHGEHIGYLPRALAQDLAPRMDRGVTPIVKITSISSVTSRKRKTTYPGVSLNITCDGHTNTAGLDHLLSCARSLNGKSGVYEIRCIREGKSYVGSSTNIGKRIQTHIRDLINLAHANHRLQSAWNRHLPVDFEVKVLKATDPANFATAETRWISKKNSYWQGYNLTIDGQGAYSKKSATAMMSKQSSQAFNVEALITTQPPGKPPKVSLKHTKETVCPASKRQESPQQPPAQGQIGSDKEILVLVLLAIGALLLIVILAGG